MPTPATESVPQKMRPIYDEISGLTDAFRAAHLNAEYAQVCRALAAKLARKRPALGDRVSEGVDSASAGG